jgi:nitrogen fixation protein FixH
MKIIIYSVIITAILAVAGSVFVGIQTFDGTVTDQPYEKGLAWDEMEKKRSDLGWSYRLENDTLKTGRNELQIALFDKEGSPLHASSVHVKISRPSTDRYDKTFTMVQTGLNQYTAIADFSLYGNWVIIVHVSQGKENLPIKNIFYVEEGERT